MPKKSSGISIMAKLIKLLKPLLPIIFITISMGVAGFLCSIFLTVYGGVGLLNLAGFATGYEMRYLLISIAVFAVLRGVLRYMEQASGHYIAFKILAVIRDQVFRALRRLAPAKLEGREKGNLISVITTDIELLEVFYAHTIAPIMIAIITSGIMVGYIGHYHVVLGLVATGSYLIVGALIPIVNSKLGREAGRSYREEFGKLNSYLLESLYGRKETLQYEDGFNRLQSIREKSEDLDSYQKKLKKKEGAAKAATDAAILLCSLAMLFTSIYLNEIGLISFQGVLIPTVALMSSFGPVVALSNLSNNLLQTLASGERVLAILEEEPVTKEIVEGKTLTDQNIEEIKVDGIEFAYESEQILSDVSIRFPKRGIVGIHGRSGSGKSTLLKLLMRFFDPVSGKILLNTTDGSIDLKDVVTKDLRANEGYMTQDTYLFQDSIEGNIKIGNLNATHEQVVEAAKMASIHDFIESLPEGYKTQISSLGSNFSGGERQRIGLARAFLHDAPILFLDEPTSNLDSLNEAIILKSLKESKKDQLVVLVSHRKSTLAVTDYMVEMDCGRLS